MESRMLPSSSRVWKGSTPPASQLVDYVTLARTMTDLDCRDVYIKSGNLAQK